MFRVNKPFRYSRRSVRVDEPVVQDNLAVTPSDMMRLASLGKPVSTQTLGAEYYDNLAEGDFYVQPIHRRGVDINDAWIAHMDSKSKLKNALNHDAMRQ